MFNVNHSEINAGPRCLLQGELDLNDFVNLEKLHISPNYADFRSITAIHLENCPRLTKLEIPSEINIFTFVAKYKREIEELKAKISELETPANSLSDPGET